MNMILITVLKLKKLVVKEYLRVSVDGFLDKKWFFDKSYKKTSLRLRLLATSRCLMDVNTVRWIHETMVRPKFSYRGLRLLVSQQHKKSPIQAL